MKVEGGRVVVWSCGRDDGRDDGEDEGEGGSESKFNADCGMRAYYIEKCTVRLRVP